MHSVSGSPAAISNKLHLNPRLDIPVSGIFPNGMSNAGCPLDISNTKISSNSFNPKMRYSADTRPMILPRPCARLWETFDTTKKISKNTVRLHSPKLTWNHKWRFGRLFSFSKVWFWSSMLVFGCVNQMKGFNIDSSIVLHDSGHASTASCGRLRNSVERSWIKRIWQNCEKNDSCEGLPIKDLAGTVS